MDDPGESRWRLTGGDDMVADGDDGSASRSGVRRAIGSVQRDADE